MGPILVKNSLEKGSILQKLQKKNQQTNKTKIVKSAIFEAEKT